MESSSNALALASIVEASSKRLAASLAEASRRGYDNLLATQLLSQQYVELLTASAAGVSAQAKVTVDVVGQLAAKVCELHDNIGKLRQVALDVEGALESMAALEQILTEFENA